MLEALPGSPPDRDEAALRRAALRQDTLTKPRGSLGALERVALQLAGLQGRELPAARPAAVLIFAADHPVVRHGVSAYPAAVTGAMLANFAAGGAAASVLARLHRLPLRVIDVGVDAATEDDDVGAVAELRDGVDATATELRDGAGAAARVRRRGDLDLRDGAGDLLHGDAMTPAMHGAALRAGADEVDALGPGLRVLVLGEMGIGNTTAAAAVYAGLLGGDPAQYVGPGTGVHGDALARKQDVVRGAVARARREHADFDDPRRVLQALGGREISAIVGAMARAISGRCAVLVDGFIVGAAALALCRIDPRWRDGMIFAHRSAEPAHLRALQALDAAPLLDLDLRLGEASGALTAFPIVEAACVLHAEMATFAAAGVPGREDMPA